MVREKTRIILTILAVAWGTFTIAAMLSIGEGLRVTFADTMANTGHNLLVIRGGRTTKSYFGKRKQAKINLVKNDYKNISRLTNVALISPVYSFSRQLRYQDKNLTKNILAVNPNYNLIHEIKVLQRGRFISPVDMAQRRAVIVLGTKTREELFKNNSNPVGKYIYLGGKPFLIIGVMKPKAQLVGHREADAFDNWIPLTTYELYTNPRMLMSIDLSYKDPAFLDSLKLKIQHAIAAEHHVSPDDENIVHLSEFAERQERINSFFWGMQVFLGIVGALTLLVAGVGIANVMYASVNQATREIGVRMAIGARTYQVIRYYITEALAATFIGGAIGLGGAFFVVTLLRKIPMKGKLFSVIGQPKPVLSIGVILIVIIILGLIGLLSGLFPALKAASIDPSEALSYE